MRRSKSYRSQCTSRGRRLRFESLENRTVLAAALPDGFIQMPVATGLDRPTAMELAPNGDLWVLEQGGRIKRFATGSASVDVVGNIGSLGLDSTGERGLLGIAFDPQYASNHFVYFYYTATRSGAHNQVSRFTVKDRDASDYYFAGASTKGPDNGVNGAPKETVIFVLNTLSGASNHNGGAIHFGPDGKLYVAVGDNANGANSQSLDNLLGKMLRIENSGQIPTDNPFFATASGNNRAIWALGLRNPFTFAFQTGTGRMFINDVGQNSIEEIDDGIAGSNYGWPNVEGNNGSPPASPGTYRAPIYTYAHGGGALEGFAITGGTFYSPATQQFPSQFAGDYFFADLSNGWINVLDVGSGVATQFATGASGPVDLRVANDGSLYYLTYFDGKVHRVQFNETSFSAKIDFQKSSAEGFAGYLADTGRPYGNRAGGLAYGWNADISKTAAKDRDASNSPDERYDTLILMQRSGNNSSWQIAVPNGDYEVHVVAGDPEKFDSVYRINVEGVLAVSGTPTSSQRWVEGTVTVTVTDGRLTVSNAAGAQNNKIAFLEINAVAESPSPSIESQAAIDSAVATGLDLNYSRQSRFTRFSAR
jgi:glucose/arabinose dehydrogenase